MSLKFSPLPDSRVKDGFSVLQLVGEWIQSQGRRQRITKTSFDTYRDWQTEKANYVVTEGEQIVGLLTLRREILKQWPDFADVGPIWMVRALATHPDHRGKGVGELAVGKAIELRAPSEPIYLDCVSEFLPEYYRKLGFTAIGQQQHNDGDGETYDITLMRYRRV